ncbi:MAG: 2-amino-4-hydroxy-6-hydroxymethyldihydropteridine diphosphokinase [Tannerella sp.]|jgi:2-amino-4-hydroxy-6-hydroxymethyldihydropteridine diphosphokinase|nr:2-amino-4-hydroxy-6-hydroxymethyldihydropteridine diphosphokinase [Tannerella sp.]
MIYLGLGSNLGDKRGNISRAVSLIVERAGEALVVSALYETPPWGFESKESFINIALGISTDLSPEDLLHCTQQIECDMGRTGKSIDGVYHDRPVDVDILLYDDIVMQSPTLVIPHPLLHYRLFVLQPLAEIAPDLIHPVLGKSIAEILQTVSKIEKNN